jgi:ribosomal protein L21E
VNFKKGDRVKVVNYKNEPASSEGTPLYNGKEGEVLAVGNDVLFPVTVRLDGENLSDVFNEDELKLLKKKGG